MDLSVETILIYTISAGILSVVYGYFTGKHILSSSPGNSKMQEIASAIQVGAKAYLNRQYKTIAIVGVVVLVIISYAFSILVGLGYLIGAALSGISIRSSCWYFFCSSLSFFYYSYIFLKWRDYSIRMGTYWI